MSRRDPEIANFTPAVTLLPAPLCIVYCATNRTFLGGKGGRYTSNMLHGVQGSRRNSARTSSWGGMSAPETSERLKSGEHPAVNSSASDIAAHGSSKTAKPPPLAAADVVTPPPRPPRLGILPVLTPGRHIHSGHTSPGKSRSYSSASS